MLVVTYVCVMSEHILVIPIRYMKVITNIHLGLGGNNEHVK